MKFMTPNIFVNDMNQTIKFYEKIGFELLNIVQNDGHIDWATLQCGDVKFMFQTYKSLEKELPEAVKEGAVSLLFYIEVEDVGKLFEHLKKNKVKILKDLETSFYGVKVFSIKDNNNYVLTFAEDEA